MTLYTAPASAFTNDFGAPVIFGSLSSSGILDQPATELAGGMVISVDYKLTYASATLPGLDSGAHVTVGGVAYRVRDVKPITDGVFSEAIMEKS